MQMRTVIAMLAWFSQGAQAQAFSEAFVNDHLTADVVTRAAQGAGFSVSVWVILFYIFYLGTIWAFNIAMFTSEGSLLPQRRKFAKYFCRANIFLAAGDTAMFIAFLVAYLFPGAFASPDGVQRL